MMDRREMGPEGNVFWDLLSLHQRQGNVLSHVVQLVGQAVGAGDVDGGAVIVAPPHCKGQITGHIQYPVHIN